MGRVSNVCRVFSFQSPLFVNCSWLGFTSNFRLDIVSGSVVSIFLMMQLALQFPLSPHSDQVHMPQPAPMIW